MTYKKWVKNIQTAYYNEAHTVHIWQSFYCLNENTHYEPSMMSQDPLNLDFGRKFAFSRSFKSFSAYLLRESQYTKHSYESKNHTLAENTGL